VVKKGQKTEINFVAEKAGEFAIVCSVYCGPGHAEMKGKLIVKEDAK
jgi:heme/copper-type cytochrome/quinol oxidase subunit 2